LTADPRVTHLLIGAAKVTADVRHIAASRHVDALLTAAAAMVKARWVAGGTTHLIVGDASVCRVAACLVVVVATDVLRLAAFPLILVSNIPDTVFLREIAAVLPVAGHLATVAAAPGVWVQAALAGQTANGSRVVIVAHHRTAAPPVAVAINVTRNFVLCTQSPAKGHAPGSANEG
jgi:hypothetical protein